MPMKAMAKPATSTSGDPILPTTSNGDEIHTVTGNDPTTDPTDTTTSSTTNESTTGEPDNSTYSAVSFPGGLDRVIVNAGLGKGAPIGTGKAHANLETVQTNLTGALAQAEAALEIFREQNSGHLVLISSVSANRGLPKAQAAYSASKAGVTALGQGLAAEFAGTPIAITVIEPGYIETDINRGVKTRLMATTDAGVAAMVAAIEAEKAHAAVPRWPWEPLAAAMRYLPEPVSRRMV